MSEMIQVTIDSVRVSLMSPQRIILLREMDGERTLPIFVGPYEAEAITVALQEIEMARPLTHDLLKNVINTFGARLVHVEVVALREKIFYGNLVVERDGEIIRIDSRPTDAIAMAVRAHIPILIDPVVMDNAGILPEEDLQEQNEGSAADDKDRLSIFEDFLDTLGSDESTSEDDSPENDPDDET